MKNGVGSHSTGPVPVAIVGAGPYGLSIAAHLAARGVPFRIFGKPMRTWLDMPKGLNLKSFGFATNVYVPKKNYTFPEYCRSRGLEDFDPCTMESFAQYGLWVQERLVPEVEPVEVEQLASASEGFALRLTTGESVRATRVVMAMGLGYFTRMPEFAEDLPAGLASHASQHRDYARFAGKDIAVIGGGSSALEAAALLNEAGARVEILVRGGQPLFFDRIKTDRSLLERVLIPNSVVGQGPLPWLLEHVPFGPYYLPEDRRVRFVRSYLGPSGSWWLRGRVEGKVPIFTHSRVARAAAIGDRVRLHVSEEGKGERVLDVDHVVAGTGYEPNVDRLSFVNADLRARIRRIEGAPALSRNFESSVKGLYFVGPVSSYSFGPLFRFVAGAEYTAPFMAGHLARKAGRSVPVIVRESVRAVRDMARRSASP